MTEIRHGLTAADQAAMTAFRARLAANSIALTRASFDKIFEQVPAAESIEYYESHVGGMPGVWCLPKSGWAEAVMLYLHGGGFVYGSARAFQEIWSARSPHDRACPRSSRAEVGGGATIRRPGVIERARKRVLRGARQYL